MHTYYIPAWNLIISVLATPYYKLVYKVLHSIHKVVITESSVAVVAQVYSLRCSLDILLYCYKGKEKGDSYWTSPLL